MPETYVTCGIGTENRRARGGWGEVSSQDPRLHIPLEATDWTETQGPNNANRPNNANNDQICSLMRDTAEFRNAGRRSASSAYTYDPRDNPYTLSSTREF